LTKNNVVVVFGPQNVSDPNREVELFGECLDVTSTKDTENTWSRSPWRDVNLVS